MRKIEMFDINNDDMREDKLRFIEILLIVGGLIGSIRLQNASDNMNILFGTFLIGSVLYYFMINDRQGPKSVTMAILLVAPTFSAIAILPFMHQEISIYYEAMIYILFLVLMPLVGLALYLGRPK